MISSGVLFSYGRDDAGRFDLETRFILAGKLPVPLSYRA
jgi:hypothetical protein